MSSKILILNCGSSSIKYEVYLMPEETSLGKGLIERIGLEKGILTQKTNGKKIEIEIPIKNHDEGIKLMLNSLLDKESGVIQSINEIIGVGHRVVHGGEIYTESILIDESVEKEIEKCFVLAPLHNPANLSGIKALKLALPNVPQVAVFDTSFHQTMPKESYLYAINESLYYTHKIRRYGFHGTSHKYVFNKSCEFLNLEPNNSNGIVLHLGNGASLCAVKKGKSYDTSMGFTPLAGVSMGTRSGDIDPSIVFYLAKNLDYSIDDIDKKLNRQSGMLGLSGISSDMRDIWAAKEKGDSRASDAISVYIHNIKKFLGSYMILLEKIDFIAFTAGVGENDNGTRELVCKGLEEYGIKMDYAKNKNLGKGGIQADLSLNDSKIKILVMPTNEELQIAKDTLENIKK